MKPTVKVNTTAFSRMTRDLAQALAMPQEDVLRAEVGKVLEKAASTTPIASVAALHRRVWNSGKSKWALIEASRFTPRRQRSSSVNLLGGKYIAYDTRGRRWPNRLWAMFEADAKKELKTLLRSRGLARRTWKAIADEMGLEIKLTPKSAAKAVPSNPAVTEGRYLASMKAETRRSRMGVSIRISNAQPTIIKLGGAGILQRAVNGRVKYFANNLRRGVFQDLQKVAKRYPGLRVL